MLWRPFFARVKLNYISIYSRILTNAVAMATGQVKIKAEIMGFVIFQKRVRVFHRGFKHEKTDESTRPQAECFYCFRVFETPMKQEARVFEITSLTKEN